MASDALERLLPDLESPDAFVRLEAEQRLHRLLQRDFGFRWDAPEESRTAAIARLRAWLEQRERAAKKRRRSEEPPTLDLEKLKALSPQEMETHLQKLIAQAPFLQGLTFQRPRCADCHQRPATLEIVEVHGGVAPSGLHLCEECAVIRGEIRPAAVPDDTGSPDAPA